MSSWGMIPFVRILIWFLPGVLLGIFENQIVSITVLFTVILCLVLFVTIKKTTYAIYFWLLLLLLGFSTSQYYQVIYPNQVLPNGKVQLVGEIIDAPIEKEKVFAFPLKITAVDKQHQPKVLCYFQKSDEHSKLTIGDVVEVNGFVNEVKPPANLGEFDYKTYLANQRIFQTIYIPEGGVAILTSSGFSVHKLADETRKWAEVAIERLKLEPSKEGIVKALLLGLKSDLTESTKLSFARTGAMHVLAVSGLHVGIIFAVFHLLFKGLKEKRFGQGTYGTLMIVGVWGFAFITGLAPSVNRAAIMFTILIVGKSLKRDVNTYNSIAASAFLMLISNPYLIFDVGFQLSYSAVAGIVFFHPKIYAWFNHLPNWLDKCWSLTAVAIAAQISTLPFTLIYFHQLPSYFWLSNIIVIPAATIILYMGMAYLFTSQLFPVTNLFSRLLDMVLEVMQSGISWLSNLPGAVIGNIHLSQLSIVMLLVSLLSLLVYVASKSVKWKIGLFVAFTAFLSIRLYDNYTRIRQQGLIAYELKSNQVSLHYSGTAGVLLSQNQISKTDFQYHIKPSLSLLGITRLDTVVTESNKKYRIKEK
jgi:competence protein ComEC